MNHNRIITPSADPDRFTEEEKVLFNAGKCGQMIGYGLPWTEWCGEPSKLGASFGHCEEHDEEMLEDHYPDGMLR